MDQKVCSYGLTKEKVAQGDHFLGQSPGKPSIPSWIQIQGSITALAARLKP